MLGLPYQSSRLVNPLLDRYSTQDVIAPYVSDSFKVNDKLTLEFGLRWDITTVPTYKDGLMYNYLSGRESSRRHPERAIGDQPVVSVQYQCGRGQSDSLSGLHNFRPRASFAYRLNDKTVIRGGYGEFSESFGYNGWLNNGGPYQITQTYTNAITNGVPLLSLPNAFPSSLSLAAIPNQSITAYPMKQDFGAIRQFNVTIGTGDARSRFARFLHRDPRLRAELQPERGQAEGQHDAIYFGRVSVPAVYRSYRVPAGRPVAL